MSKVAVAYWTGSGNTEAMAAAVAEGAETKGATVEQILAADFSLSAAEEYNAYAFGCPAMGAEELEDSEFQPCGTRLRAVSATRRSYSLALTAGAAESGWTLGRKMPKKPASTSSTPSSSTNSPMTMASPPARPSAPNSPNSPCDSKTTGLFCHIRPFTGRHLHV